MSYIGSSSSSSSSEVRIGIIPTEKKENLFINAFKVIANPLEALTIETIKAKVTMPEEHALHQLFYLTTLKSDPNKLPFTHEQLGVLQAEAASHGHSYKWIGKGVKGAISLLPLITPGIVAVTQTNLIGGLGILAGLTAASFLARDLVDYKIERSLILTDQKQWVVVAFQLQKQFHDMAGWLLQLYCKDDQREFAREINNRIDCVNLQSRMMSVIKNEALTSLVLCELASVVQIISAYAVPDEFHLRTYSERPLHKILEKETKEILPFKKGKK